MHTALLIWAGHKVNLWKNGFPLCSYWWAYHTTFNHQVGYSTPSEHLKAEMVPSKWNHSAFYFHLPTVSSFSFFLNNQHSTLWLQEECHSWSWWDWPQFAEGSWYFHRSFQCWYGTRNRLWNPVLCPCNFPFILVFFLQHLSFLFNMFYKFWRVEKTEVL